MKVDLEFKNESNDKDNSEIEVFHPDGDVVDEKCDTDSEEHVDDSNKE